MVAVEHNPSQNDDDKNVPCLSQVHKQTGWWFQPIWKNISQIENLPQIGVNIKHFETTTQQTIREKLWFSAMWSSNK